MKRIIAIVGMPGSGKSVFAEALSHDILPIVRFGGVVTSEVERRGLPLTPEHERLVREELRKKNGMDTIARLALSAVHKSLQNSDVVVIDGLYSFSEYKFLKSEFGDALFVVAIVAQRAIRYRRLSMRLIRPLTPLEAFRRDVQEIENLEKGGPIAIADFTIVNDGTPDEILFQAKNLRVKFSATDPEGNPLNTTEYESFSAKERADFLRERVRDDGTDLSAGFVLKMLQKEHDPASKWHLIKAAGLLQIEAAIPMLTDIFREPDVDFYGETSLHLISAWSLGRIGKQAIKPVMGLLNSEDLEVRKCAVDALGEIGDSQAVDALCAALQNDHHTVKLWAGLALSKIGPPALNCLKRIAEQVPGETRAIAMDALNKIKNRSISVPQ